MLYKKKKKKKKPNFFLCVWFCYMFYISALKIFTDKSSFSIFKKLCFLTNFFVTAIQTHVEWFDLIESPYDSNKVFFFLSFKTKIEINRNFAWVLSISVNFCMLVYFVWIYIINSQTAIVLIFYHFRVSWFVYLWIFELTLTVF